MLASPPARACAVCAAGDPTLSTMGTELPFVGRLRGALEARLGGLEVAGTSLSELRIEGSAVYMPTRALALSVTLPVLRRVIDAPSEPSLARVSLGDVEGRIKATLWSDREGSVRMAFGLFAGMKLPTAPVQTDALGKVLPSDLQPGCSAVVPLAGAFTTVARGPYSLYASAGAYLPVPVRDAPHPGDSMRTTAAFQVQPVPSFATRLGLTARLDGPGELQGGSADPNSGGFIGYASTELLMSPLPDLLIAVGAFFPAIQALRGVHREDPIGALSITYDFL